STFTNLRVWILTKGLLRTETCQLLQHPLAPPRRYIVTEDLPPGSLPLDMAKPPTQQQAAFHDTTMGESIILSCQDRSLLLSGPRPTYRGLSRQCQHLHQLLELTIGTTSPGSNGHLPDGGMYSVSLVNKRDCLGPALRWA
ncbi:hypothetical protein LEMLEM_LOCUS24693, partial [Lemmus lemmus]